MASTNSRIRSLNIIFTPSSTIIGENISTNSTTYIRIQVNPDHNGKNIGNIIIWYYDPDSSPSRFNEEINDSNMLTSIPYVMSDLFHHDTLVDQIASYLNSLPKEEISIIMKEYTKYIEDGILLDGFIAGVASYLSFLLLNENSIFMNQMSFQITVPYNIHDSNCITGNMFKYLSLPLSGLSRISSGVLFQLVLFLQSFINIWEPAFSPGPTIDNKNEAKICMEVISGLANDATIKLSQIQSYHNIMISSLNDIESRLRLTINESLNKMKLEINNLLVETRSSIKDLTDHFTNQLNLVDGKIEEAVSTIDGVVKHKIVKIVESELDSQIKSKIASEIEDTHERIGEIISNYSMSGGRKIVTGTIDENESIIQGKLQGLEHRIEVLYNNLSIGSGKNTITSEYKDVNGKLYNELSTNRQLSYSPPPTTKYHGEIFPPDQQISGSYNIIPHKTTPQNNLNQSQSAENGSITPLSGNMSSTNLHFNKPPGSKSNFLEGSYERETNNINPKRRITITRGQGESNPTSISDGGIHSSKWIGTRGSNFHIK